MENLSVNNVHIYTDGACKNNPGTGGWAAILICNYNHEIVDNLQNINHYYSHKISEAKLIIEIGDGEKETTNNRMEMSGVIFGLDFFDSIFDHNTQINIFTDSMYVKDGIEKWVHNWEKNNWITSQKTPVKNQDLWKKILSHTKNKNIKWEWVQGHSGNEYNEQADKIAKIFSNKTDL